MHLGEACIACLQACVEVRQLLAQILELSGLLGCDARISGTNERVLAMLTLLVRARLEGFPAHEEIGTKHVTDGICVCTKIQRLERCGQLRLSSKAHFENGWCIPYPFP